MDYKLPPHPPLRPHRRRASRGQHRARPRLARRVQGLARERACRRRQRRRTSFVLPPLPVLRRPDDRRRDLRRLAPGAVAIPGPDQDRHLMTVATHPPSHRRSPPLPAARRNTSAMPAQGCQSSIDRHQRLAPAHPRHQNRPPSPLPLKTPSAAPCRRLARQPSATLKSP